MSLPPQTMTIELDERDVREDLSGIVNNMSRMRSETLRDRNLSDEQKDEYLHMAYRLASGIRATADENMDDKIQFIAKKLSENQTLLGYDPMQDAYWKKHEAEFISTLENLLIGVVRDDFHTVDAKHHILQAIKYLDSEDADFEDREKVYRKILPFHGPISFQTKEGIFKRVFGKLFGYQYSVRSLNDHTLKVDARSHGFTPELVELARNAGYTTLNIDMGYDEWESFPTASFQIQGSRMVSWRAREPNKKLVGVASKILKYTKPLSYAALGSLPGSLQRRLKVLPNFNEESAFVTSNWTEVIGGLVGSVIYSVATGSGWLLVWGGIPLVVDGISRAMRGFKDTSTGLVFEEAVGSIFLKPLFYPLEKYLGGRSDKIASVEVPVGKIRASEQLPNPVGFYDDVARLDIPENVKKSLVWGLGNHHAFGKAFISYVKETVGGPPEKIKVETGIDRESQSVVYGHGLSVDGFRKSSLLYCSAGRRYLVTAIGPDNGNNNFVGNTGKVLAGDFDNIGKLEKIGKVSNSRFVHLKEYQKGEVISDLEAMQ